MADDVQFDITITIPVSVEAAGDMPNKWASGLTNNAELINDRRKEKIPDEGTFQSKIAVPSSTKYSPMIDAAFLSQAGRNRANINRAQYKNLADNFNHWNDKLDLSFAEVDGVVAKRFKDQVNNSKDNWATEVAAKTLRATGDKIRGTILGQALFWTTGDPLANGMTNLMAIIDGGPYQAIHIGRAQAFRAAMMGMQVQACIQIITADFLVAEIAAQNTRLQNLCNAMIEPGVVKSIVVGGGAADSLYQFEYADPTYLLHVRMVTV